MVKYAKNMEGTVTKKKDNYELVDLLKFIFAIFIVGIHTSIMNNFESNAQWYILHLFFRMAVPFFFIASGFFYGKKCKNGKIKDNAIKQVKRLIVPFVFWLLVSLPYVIISMHGENVRLIIIKVIRQLIFYPWGALWFLSASMVAIVLSSFFIKKNKLLLAIIISIALYVIALLGNSYYFLLDNISILKKMMDFYIKIFITVRNGIFVGFPIFIIGVYLSTKESNIEKIGNKKIVFFLFIGIIVHIFEITFIRNKNYIDDHGLFFSTIYIAALLLMICIHNNIKFRRVNPILLRNLSTGIYFTHSPINKYISLINNNINCWVKFFITLFLSITVCLIVYKINNKYINKVFK